MEQLFLTIPQVCDVLQISRSTVYQLMDQPDGLARTKIGRSARIHVDEVRRWVEQQQASQQSPAIRRND